MLKHAKMVNSCDSPRFFDFFGSYTIFGVDLSIIIFVVVIVAVAFILERLKTRYLTRFALLNFFDFESTFEGYLSEAFY
jgi:ribose/xylose/arabinose/galactoside ABC-type transport system permease subunit